MSPISALFLRRVLAYISEYYVALGGVDAIVFTGGVGENQIHIRRTICEQLRFMGVDLDVDANNIKGEEKMITSETSKIKAYVIPTNEELMIARETKRLINK